MGGATTVTRRLRMTVRGAVQGVGFRPFVFRTAEELGLGGWVVNDPRGVVLEVEGDEDALRRFVEAIRSSPPPRAVVDELREEWLDPAGYPDFRIRGSDEAGERSAFVLPDVATCDACLEEVLDPRDRRHLYPFANCTDCGPRFSIIRALPYDRPNTTMAGFRMCPACRAEYDDPRDRRFHAQPNACPACGPHLELRGGDGEALRTVDDGFPGGGADAGRGGDAAAVEAAARVLAGGGIVAVKGLGGFHLMVDARNEAAVASLRERKGRPRKPLAVMVRDPEEAARICRVDADAGALLASPEAPIVLLPGREGSGIAESVAPGNPYLGVMVPYTPLHHHLLRATGFPVVATSGNRSEEPICTDEEEAAGRLRGIPDLFLVHDRPIERHVDDSVAWVVDGAPALLRRARGYAPLPVTLPREVPPILAVGGHLKNAIALSRGRHVFLGQHIGDLETLEARTAFEAVVDDFLRLYRVMPRGVAHDMHPDYASTRRARRLVATRWEDAGVPLLPVQHHHAHLASVLAEHGVEGPALGIVWDGTGYGPDGTIWGGEFLLGDAGGYRRIAHLRPFRLPGGDAAVREPRRSALALLREGLGADAAGGGGTLPEGTFGRGERRILLRMLETGTNAPATTSAGRLFDGVASLLGLRQRSTFEGEAAMAVEFAADAREEGAYPFPLEPARGEEGGGEGPAPAGAPLHLDWGPAVRSLLDDVRSGVAPGTAAARFQNGLVEGAVAVAETAGAERVALSGGCFQNRILVERTAAALRARGFRVLLNRRVPPNDGGIALGQVAVAAATIAEGG